MNKEKKPRIFSGVQPTGDLHIGNYLGAISQWVKLQENYESIFCVVDYHAITVKHNPENYGKKIIDIAKTYLAAGIDPQKSIIFQQSDIKEHTELCWILNCVAARMSDMKKMTQFKDKAGENQENVSVGLFDYPVLMAADILLYDTEVVPVGEDQVQHVELARTLGRRFNSAFGDVFRIPLPQLRKEGARIMGLDNPLKKMSKSAPSELNYISLKDDVAKAGKKIMKAQTDIGSDIKFDEENKPGISNLLAIYSLLADKTIKELEKEYAGLGYGAFKKDLAEVVKSFLDDFQKKYNRISDKEIRDIMDKGAEKLQPIARETVDKVKKAIGIA